ncbi:MAG TPA: hypothetical protein VK806_07595 [Bacteroidia bacterium]|jgi:hypothetical protein|nr:hypothetical protein [Bacteroidia bacterium]
MLKKIIVITLLLCIKVCAGQVKYKMVLEQPPSYGQFKIAIIPLTYDSTVSDQKVLSWADSLETGIFGIVEYYLLYTGDSTKMGLHVNKALYYFVHIRYTMTEFWKNGNKKSITYFSKRLKRYWTMNFHSNATPESKGHFNGEKKKGKWTYYDTLGRKVRKERYNWDGVLLKTRDYNPPKKTFTTIFNPKHPQGAPYIIQ